MGGFERPPNPPTFGTPRRSRGVPLPRVMFGTPRPSRGRSSTSRDVRNAPAEPWAFLYLAWRSEGPAEAWRFSILLVWQRTYFVVGALVSSVGVAVSFFIVSDFL